MSNMTVNVTKRVNLESLISNEELEELKEIRVKKIPKQIDQLGEGATGEVFVFKFEDGSLRAGKKPKISRFNKSAKEQCNLQKHLSYALGEIKMLHQLSHDRIIKFFGFYLDEQQILIFMEVMAGSVKSEIDKKECLSEMEAMHYFTQAAEGLVYLHTRKPRAIIHRDIKSENLLLTAENNVKLADFGLAIDLAISSSSISIFSTAPSSFAGTYLFTAPEIIEKMVQPDAYGRKSDVWSLACTLVQMVSGEPPYGNLNFFEFVQRSSNDSSNPLTYSGDLLPRASNALKWLLNSLFVADSKVRPNAKRVLRLAYDVIRKAAEQGDIIGQNNLGEMYYFGQGIPQSDDEAVKWFRKAAEQGNASAQNKLRAMYQTGRAVPKSDDETVKWYRKAAEQGNESTGNDLDIMYENGRTVPKSEDEAVKWYRKVPKERNELANSNIIAIRRLQR